MMHVVLYIWQEIHIHPKKKEKNPKNSRLDGRSSRPSSLFRFLVFFYLRTTRPHSLARAFAACMSHKFYNTFKILVVSGKWIRCQYIKKHETSFSIILAAVFPTVSTANFRRYDDATQRWGRLHPCSVYGTNMDENKKFTMENSAVRESSIIY